VSSLDISSDHGGLPKEMRPLIFVVDYDRVIAATLAAVLKLNDYDARAYKNPLEALEDAGRYRPNLVIIDPLTPELSGIDLALQFKEQNPTCKILFMAAVLDPNILQRTRDRGYDFKILWKPIPPEEILARIKEELG
jgi:DNA-binding response OmpR family regulator